MIKPVTVKVKTIVYETKTMTQCGSIPIKGQQGFMIDGGVQFLNRKDAADHAVECGQIKEPQWPPNLFSEDIW